MVSLIGLLQRGGVDARVLADVERVQMKPEGAHLQNERIDERARDADSAVCGKRSAQGLEIVEKILDRAVGRQRLRQFFMSARQGVGRDGQARAGRAGNSPACSSVR